MVVDAKLANFPSFSIIIRDKFNKGVIKNSGFCRYPEVLKLRLQISLYSGSILSLLGIPHRDHDEEVHCKSCPKSSAQRDTG